MRPCVVAVEGDVARLKGLCPPGAQVRVYTYRSGVPPRSAVSASLPQRFYATGIGGAALPPCAWQADVVTASGEWIGARLGGSIACGSSLPHTGFNAVAPLAFGSTLVLLGTVIMALRRLGLRYSMRAAECQ